jgi:subtilisin family serine protease
MWLCVTAQVREPFATSTDQWRRVPLRSRRNTSRDAEFGFRTDNFGITRAFRRGLVLARFKNSRLCEAVLVAKGTEASSVAALVKNRDVAFAELDVVLTRQFDANDPGLRRQWHHTKIQSANAWAISLATHKVTLAILDSPFQMNHPDLMVNTVAGWDMVTERPISGVTEGLYHSTIAAGLAAAVIDNSLGVSGIANCWLMPINIGDNPSTSDMHEAVVWAADHGVRVVNLSWDGAFSSVINEAGAYLKTKTGGMLFMSGVNGRKFLNYPDQPDIYAISMTDTNDQPRSAYGEHIDFAAPGWEIYSTTTNSTYEVDSGTSYSSPLVAGIAAWVMSVNPELGPAEIEGILRESAVDLGTRGRDQDFGWGRVDFGRVAANTFATLPVSRIVAVRDGPVKIVAVRLEGAGYRLFRRDLLNSPWLPVTDATWEANQNMVIFTDPNPPAKTAFYRVEITLPREAL